MFRNKKHAAVVAGAGDITVNAEPNPYLGNREESDDRNRNDAVDKHNWQTAWRLTMGLLVMSMSFNGYYMMQSKFVPYVFAVDKFGTIVQVGAVDRATSLDPKRITRGEIKTWIENTRSVYGDNQAEKRIVNAAYARVSSQGKAKRELDDYFRDRNVFDMAKNGQGVSIEIHVVLPVGKNSYQVEWTETTRNAEGAVTAVQSWKGMFTYEITPLDTEDGIARNSVGFFITDFSWSKTI